MTFTHTPKYIYVIIAQLFVITNLSGRTCVRTEPTVATPTARQP